MGDARLILCRHGTTRFNRKAGSEKGTSAERIRGWIDVPLDDEGREQAKLLAERLKEFDVKKVYCSPLVRSEETAQRIALELNVPLELDRGLMPWNVGAFAGKPTADVLPKMKLLVLHDDRSAPNGEPFRQFRQRFLKTLVALLDRAKSDGAEIVAVTHTRNMQLAKAWLAAGARADMSVDDTVMNDYSKEVGTGGLLVLAAT